MSPKRDYILEFRILTLRDPEAFGEYYELSKVEIYRFILSRTASHEMAEDLTSEVFLKACQYLFEEQRQVEHLRGLLFSIARTSVIDHFRRAGKHEELLAGDDPVFLKLADNKISSSDEVNKSMNWQKLWQTLKTLKHEYGEVLALRYVDDLSIEEMASVFGKSAGAVRVLLHRATKALEEAVNKRNSV